MDFFGLPQTKLLTTDEDREDYQKQYQKSINSIAMLQPQGELPDWMTRNPDDLMGELLHMYGAIPGMVNPRGIKKAYGSQIDTVTGMGGQLAQNAANEAVARAGINGGQINSAMVKAQTMLPVYDQTAKLRTDEAKDVAEQQKARAGMMSSLAAQIGNLRTNYLSSLGQLQLAKTNSATNFTTSMMELARRTPATSTTAPTTPTGSRLNANGTPFMTAGDNPGYIPNSGAVRPGTGIYAGNGNSVSIGGGNATMGVNFFTPPTPKKPKTIEDYLLG